MRTKADHKRSFANRLGFVAKHGGAPAAPLNTTPAAITGTVEVGETLIYMPGVWSGRPAPKVEAVWMRSGVAIGPATTDLEISPADIGAKFRIGETATSASGVMTILSAETVAVPDPEEGGA